MHVAFLPQIRQLDARRHDRTVFLLGHVIVADRALHRRADGHRMVNLARRGAVQAQEVLIAGRAVTLGAIGRHLRRIFVVPVGEGAGLRICMRRSRPDRFDSFAALSSSMLQPVRTSEKSATIASTISLCLGMDFMLICSSDIRCLTSGYECLVPSHAGVAGGAWPAG